MKKFVIFVGLLTVLACSKDSDTEGTNDPPPNNGGGNNADCGSYNGYTLYKDNEGCYYTGGNYSKVYVDGSLCTCE